MSIQDVDRVFNSRDVNIMQWVFCRLYCESNQDQFTDYQLFLRSGVRGVMGDEALMKSYTLDDADNIYKGFIRKAIQGLIDRGFVEENELINEDGSRTLFFRKTDTLREKCPEFMQYLLGNIDSVGV